jgi:hypothetical protein
MRGGEDESKCTDFRARFLIGRFPPSALSHRGRRLGIGPVQRVSAAILSTLACPSRSVSPHAANSRSKFDRTTPIEKISRRPASGFYRRRSVNPRLGQGVQYVEGVLKDGKARERGHHHDITGK